MRILIANCGLRIGEVPFFADQPIWGQKLAQLGVSPQPIPYKNVSERTLAEAIEAVLSDEEMRYKAQELKG